MTTPPHTSYFHQSDTAAQDALAFCVAEGLIRGRQNLGDYSASEIYRLKLIRVIIGNMRVVEELDEIRRRMPSDTVQASAPPTELPDPEKARALIYELLEDFPDRV
jgi:hypothetical protein